MFKRLISKNNNVRSLYRCVRNVLFLPLNNVIINTNMIKIMSIFWGKIKLVECCKNVFVTVKYNSNHDKRFRNINIPTVN